MKKIKLFIAEMITGAVFGILNGINCSVRGFIVSIILFTIAGMIFGYFSNLVNKMTNDYHPLIKIIVNPIVKAVFLFGLIHSFIWRNGNLLYLLFDYRERDPLGPSFLWLLFLYIVPLWVLFANLFLEIKRLMQSNLHS